MKRLFAAAVTAVSLFAAGRLPNRYIVELNTEPVAAHVRAAARLHSLDAERHRALIRAEQSAVRSAVEAAGGHVLGSVQNVKNALIVEMPDALAAGLVSIPGVRRLFAEREFHMTLDHALPLMHVPEAWTQVGVTNAGAGIKIGFIDSGIDITHPGFADTGFTAPAGFPVADTIADLALTNNKVIVARSYASLFPVPDPDTSAQDHQGHGTATAMAAAGVPNSGPLAPISGAAPAAFLGSYKVFGTPGVNDSTGESAILQALDDAVADGMDVINMSFGSNLAPLPSEDLEVQAVEQTTALGIIVVASAGNNGPDPETVASPADAPSVIAAGASNNDRLYSAGVIAGGGTFQATPAAGVGTPQPITATLMDVAALDGTGKACSSLPANSLTGSIAFVLRGNCTFESKLDSVQAAGAVGALVYDNVAGENPVIMSIGGAMLPAEMLSNADGLTVKQQIGSGFSVTLDFSLQAFYTNPAQLATFSAQGPNTDFSIKPDLVAVGQNLYTAAGTFDPNGPVYDPSGYTLVDGTSFSAPLVAGAAAIVKQARPGLTAGQYRSLLVDSASPASLTPGVPATVQQSGTGLLNVFAALNASAAASPVNLGFGAGGDFSAVQNLTITNIGSVSDQFQLAVAQSHGNGPVPSLPVSSVQLDPGASAVVPVTFVGNGLAPGQYEGFITIQGMLASAATRVPYWYGVPSGVPAHITVLYNASADGPLTAGARLSDVVIFRVTDGSGLPVSGVLPIATAVSGGGSVLGVTRYNGVPNSFGLSVRAAAGTNVFQIQVGSLTTLVDILAQ